MADPQNSRLNVAVDGIQETGRARRASALDTAFDKDVTLRRTTSRQAAESEGVQQEQNLAISKTLPESDVRTGRNESLQIANLASSREQESAQTPQNPPTITRPNAIKLGPADVIHEVPFTFASPSSERQRGLFSPSTTRPPSPTSGLQTPAGAQTPRHLLDVEDHHALGYPDIGTISSWRGASILIVTCGAQLLDNVFMTGVNISLPAIQKDFDVDSGELQWLISAYTLTFGGFLLLAGVMSDRYGRKHIFTAGMAVISVWTLANGFATSSVQLAIFRALQGIGAAMTVPSGVGIISSFFISRDRTKALTYFGAAGAVGFCLGLILGGFITSSLGWRYLFYITVIVTSILGALGFFILPKDRMEGAVRPRLDILGAGLSTGGLILLSFVLSSGGEYGWSKAFIIALLIVSIAMLFVFTWVEKKVQNPIMPLSLWKVPNFGAIWISGFVMYGGYQTLVYYLTLVSQDIVHLSAGATALRLLPMGIVGGTFAVTMGTVMEKFNVKYLLLLGLALCSIGPIPMAVMEPDDLSFWKHIFPSSLIGVAGIAIGYCTITVVLLASVPVSAKSLCGGMVNTAFQLGSGVGLALATAVVQATEVNKGRGLLAQYKVGTWCCVGMAALGLLISAVGVRNVKVAHEMTGAVH